MMIVFDTNLQAEIDAAAERYFWRARLLNNHRLPTRQLMNVALAAISDFRAAGDELPKTEMAKFVDSAEAWLTRVGGRIWKLAAEEETGR